jgi:hypothetical protein
MHIELLGKLSKRAIAPNGSKRHAGPDMHVWYRNCVFCVLQIAVPLPAGAERPRGSDSRRVGSYENRVA